MTIRWINRASLPSIRCSQARALMTATTGEAPKAATGFESARTPSMTPPLSFARRQFAPTAEVALRAANGPAQDSRPSLEELNKNSVR